MRRFQKRFQNAAANVVKIDLIKGLLGDGFYVRSFCSRIKRGEEEEGGRGRGNSNHILLNSDEMRMEHTTFGRNRTFCSTYLSITIYI